MTAAELGAYLDASVPLTRALAVEVAEATDGCVRLTAPLAPNQNHRQTAFGGSVASLAILSGWGWLHSRLAESIPPVRLVIQRQEVDYLAPIDDTFEAVCRAPPEAAWQRFLRVLAARGRGRLELTAEVRCRGQVAARFRGLYVAIAAERTR